MRDSRLGVIDRGLHRPRIEGEQRGAGAVARVSLQEVPRTFTVLPACVKYTEPFTVLKWVPAKVVEAPGAASGNEIAWSTVAPGCPRSTVKV